VNLIQLIADVLITCRANAASKHISLRSDVAHDFPFAWPILLVCAVLINLIDNGIKFTPNVEVSPSIADSCGRRQLSVYISVRHGCGISLKIALWFSSAWRSNEHCPSKSLRLV